MKISPNFIMFCLLSLSCSTQAQSKHAAKTIYPSYRGLIMAGYQGWFRIPEGGRYLTEERKCRIDMWPDVSEYETTYPTPFKLADGTGARFFSSTDKSTVDLHFKWMKDYGVDGVFMQRFFGRTRSLDPDSDSARVLKYAFAAASKNRRAIAIMYDLSGLNPSSEDCSSVIEDWKMLVDKLKVTNQSGTKTYLHYQGKPLVAIWGVGFADRSYNIREIGLQRLIDFLKNDPAYGGCAVMLGVPTYWRDLNADCRPDPYLHELIKQADLIMPWQVQRFTPLLYNEMDRYRDLLLDDMQWCRENNIGYVPCVCPGFSWHNLSVRSHPDDIKPVGSIPRQGGRFYWQQISTALLAGADMLYVAMFDEVNEGTAIFKCTDNPPVSDAVQFITMDGKPSDHYLWLTGEAGRMLRNEKPLSLKMPERQRPPEVKP